MINLKNYLLDMRKNENRLGFMPFFMAGYPNKTESIDTMKILLKYGDILEVGIPFSDPSADGPIIQNAGKIAIENGFKTSDTFDLISEANSDFQKPIVILCYLNTVIQYGTEKFMIDAKDSGVNAILIPDLPPEEINFVKKFANENKIELVFIISTNTPIERVKFIDSISNSFIYFVSKPSTTGITDSEISQETIDSINNVKSVIKNPLYIGFGISNRRQIEQYQKQTKADGFIVGSKIISIDKNEDLTHFLSGLF